MLTALDYQPHICPAKVYLKTLDLGMNFIFCFGIERQMILVIRNLSPSQGHALVIAYIKNYEEHKKTPQTTLYGLNRPIYITGGY